MTESAHKNHKSIVNRIRRASGHLQRIVTMIEQERSCLELAQQMHAVQRAVENAKTALIQDHLDHCLESALQNPAAARKTVTEFQAITRFL